MLYINIIENKMTGSIFSQLPNNLIMNIIKMAEDERKKDEEAREQHEEMFWEVDSELSHHFIKNVAQYNLQGEIVKDTEYLSPKQVLSFLRGRDYDDPYDEDPETYRERSAEYDYNNPNENDYDWGEEFEPSWA